MTCLRMRSCWSYFAKFVQGALQQALSAASPEDVLPAFLDAVEGFDRVLRALKMPPVSEAEPIRELKKCTFALVFIAIMGWFGEYDAYTGHAHALTTTPTPPIFFQEPCTSDWSCDFAGSEGVPGCAGGCGAWRVDIVL